MQLPNRDEWMRMGYTALGGSGAILWNKYLPLANKGGGYLPPAALAAVVLFSENAGDTEKDIAAGILGYLLSAQAISFAAPPASEQIAAAVDNPAPEAPMPVGGLEAEAAKLQKIRAVTGTLGAIADIVGRFKGNG